jgi:hypothetical protein
VRVGAAELTAIERRKEVSHGVDDYMTAHENLAMTLASMQRGEESAAAADNP